MSPSDLSGLGWLFVILLFFMFLTWTYNRGYRDGLEEAERKRKYEEEGVLTYEDYER